MLSLFCDVLYMTRLWLVPFSDRYTIPTIQRLYTSRTQKKTQKKKKGMGVAIFFGDVLLCLASAITLILLLYWLNNGSFRAAAPLGMALGFWLCHISLSKGVRIALQWLAFGIETVFYTLLMPLKRLFGWITRAYQKNAKKRRQKRFKKQRSIYTKQELGNIEKAAQMLLPIYTKTRMQKGDRRARKTKKAV